MKPRYGRERSAVDLRPTAKDASHQCGVHQDHPPGRPELAAPFEALATRGWLGQQDRGNEVVCYVDDSPCGHCEGKSGRSALSPQRPSKPGRSSSRVRMG